MVWFKSRTKFITHIKVMLTFSVINSWVIFLRCIKPNDKQKPGEFIEDRVKTQLKYNGVKEIARIRTFGFPIRLSRANFEKQ